MTSKMFNDLGDEKTDSKAVFSGVRWTGISQVITESVRMVVSILLARLLSPEDFGLLSMAGVVTGFFMVLQYLGAPGVVIQRQKLSNSLTSSLFLLNMLFSLILFSALLVAAPLLASIYKTPQLTPIIQALGAASVLTAVAAVPAAILNRRMRFDLLAWISFFTALTQGVVAIILAKMHYQVWALVIANIASSFVTVICTWWMVGWRPQLTFVWVEVKEVMAYCLHLTGTGLIEYFSRDSDKFILGKWLGDRSLGYYTMACRFCLYPPTTISPILNRVLFPAFARVQDDLPQLQKIMLRSIGAITFITLPIVAGIMVVANPFIMAILGAKWAPAIQIMVLLSPVGYLLSISGPANQMIMALGRANWMFWLTISAGIVTVGAFLGGLFWGMVGVVIAYFIVTVPLTWLRYFLACRLIKLPMHQLVSCLYRYFVGSLVMAGAVYGSRKILELMGLPALPIICIVVPMGIILYILMMLIWRPPAVYDFYQVLPTRIKNFTGRLLSRVSINLE
jgi:O-antigen/teichoic acid export membrane protein